MSKTTKPIEMISMELISSDQATQVRVQFDDDAIQHYAELIALDVKLPPAELYFDKAESMYFVADGWHRYFAHEKHGSEEIPAVVSVGTQRDALIRALGANHDHGVHRNNADKRNAVTIALQDSEWSQWSDRRVASMCGVNRSTVSRIREELTPEHEQVAQSATSTSETRTGKDGKQHPVRKDGPSKTENTSEKEGSKSKPPKQGAEEITPAARKAAKAAFGVLSRFVDTCGLNDLVGTEMESIAEKLSKAWGSGR